MVEQLSGGELQRFAIGIVAAQDADGHARKYLTTK